MNTSNKKMNNIRYSRVLFSIFLMTFVINISQAYVTVGPSNDPNCDYHSLYQAITDVANQASENIRLVGNNNGYVSDGNILFYEKNITITGGYDSCSDNSSSHTNPSVISAYNTGIPNLSIVGVSNDFETRLVLVSVHVKNGNNSKGGGVKITGNAHLVLNGSEIKENTATEQGAGIYIKSGKLSINYDSKITDNESDSLAGGVYCQDGEINYFSGEISDNKADFGAGMYLNNCQLNASSGNGNKIISQNRGRYGVGIYAMNGTQIMMGNNTSLSLFEDNQNTNMADANSVGGALFLENSNTNAEFINTHFKSNKNASGAAVYLQDSASFKLTSTANCVIDGNYKGCASFENNRARGAVDGGNTGGVFACEVFGGKGGAIYAREASVILDGVAVHNNFASRDGCTGVDYVRGREPRGAAFYVVSSNLKVIDSVIDRNGGDHAKSIIYFNESTLDLIQSTIVKNRIDVDATIRAVGNSPKIYLWGSIIAEGNTDIFDYSSGDQSVLMGGCNIVSRLSQLTNGGFGTENLESTIQDDPDFVDTNTENYNLRVTSPAIDYCDFATMQNTGFSEYFAKDYHGTDRAYVLTSAIYPMDLGAIEYSNGTFTGQSDLRLSASGDTTSSLNGNIEYVFNVENLGEFSSDQAKLTIQLDENTGQSWIDIIPENPLDWNCNITSRTINCNVLGDFHVNRIVSPLFVHVSADVIDITTIMNASLSDYRSLDPNAANNKRTISTAITGISDVIFKHGFED